MTTEKRDALFKALDGAIVAILRRELDMSFEEAAQKYREVEVDFVAAAPDEESYVLETRRRIAERILCAARSHEQPFEVCFDAWNDLVRLGFTNTYQETLMTWFFADCCLMNEKPEAGTAVLEPLIAALKRRIEEPDEKRVSLYQQELARLHKLRAELIAQRDGASQDK